MPEHTIQERVSPRAASAPRAEAPASPAAPSTHEQLDQAARLGVRLESVPAVRRAADEGLGAPSGRLPHADRIARSFGRHDVTGLRAHVGPAAAHSARSLGALAFTEGEHVVFAGTPDLRVAAHEAAHAIQQRADAGAGEAQERHADAVADRVVAGRSAAPLLDGLRPRPGATPTVQRFKDPKQRESVISHFDSLRPNVLKAIIWLDLYDAITVADRMEVLELCTWMTAKQEAFARRYIATHGINREIRALVLSGQLAKEDAKTAIATVEMFAYLSDNAERFTEAMVPKIADRVKEIDTDFKAQKLNAYDSMSTAVDSMLLDWLEKEIMSKLQAEIPDAHAKGLVIPIVEFAQNAGFFYEDGIGLIPDAPALWAKGIHDMLAKGLEVLEEGARVVDEKQKKKFIRMLASGGCFPKRTAMAEEGLKPDVEETLQGTLNKKLAGSQSRIDMIQRALFAMQEFFLQEKLGKSYDPSKKDITAKELDLVNGRVFKAWVGQKLQGGLTAQKEPLEISEGTVDTFIREQYPFQHPDDQRQMELEAEKAKAQKQTEATLDVGWQQVQNKFVEPLSMGDVARMKLQPGLKLTLKEDKKTVYELVEVDTNKKVYKFKLVG